MGTRKDAASAGQVQRLVLDSKLDRVTVPVVLLLHSACECKASQNENARALFKFRKQVQAGLYFRF